MISMTQPTNKAGQECAGGRRLLFIDDEDTTSFQPCGNEPDYVYKSPSKMTSPEKKAFS